MDENVLATVRRLPGVRSAHLLSPTTTGVGLGDLQASQVSLLSALVGALGQASDGMGVGALSEAMIEGVNGSIVARSLGEEVGAVVVTEAKANLGLIRLELRKLPRSSP